MILTHVVQTLSVPNPSALLEVFQSTNYPRSKHSMPSPPLTTEQEHLEHRHPYTGSDCSCALLQANNDDGKFGTGREAAFLAACYCPDPWEFQSRVLRQIEHMQQDMHTLRQEMLEIQKRTTIRKRQEFLEKERSRDKEWVELNERLHNTLLVVGEEEANKEDSEMELLRRGSDHVEGGGSLELLTENTETEGSTSTDTFSKGKGILDAQGELGNQGIQMTGRREDDGNFEKNSHDVTAREVSWASDYPPVSANTDTMKEE
ncbi:hypothetical protein BGX27_002816 [Mortierella sp. AM989]|nr:hypothetical protein BGX27_002816 [Mortierella sp. AM989]